MFHPKYETGSVGRIFFIYFFFEGLPPSWLWSKLMTERLKMIDIKIQTSITSLSDFHDL